MLRHLFGRNHSHKDSYCPICGGKHAFTTDDFEEELKPFHTHILKKQEKSVPPLNGCRSAENRTPPSSSFPLAIEKGVYHGF